MREAPAADADSFILLKASTSIHDDMPPASVLTNEDSENRA